MHDFKVFNGRIAWFYAVKKYFIIVNFSAEKLLKKMGREGKDCSDFEYWIGDLFVKSTPKSCH